jgi:hypothetical protein
MCPAKNTAFGRGGGASAVRIRRFPDERVLKREHWAVAVALLELTWQGRLPMFLPLEDGEEVTGHPGNLLSVLLKEQQKILVASQTDYIF